jgi:hypothetical protein
VQSVSVHCDTVRSQGVAGYKSCGESDHLLQQEIAHIDKYGDPSGQLLQGLQDLAQVVTTYRSVITGAEVELEITGHSNFDSDVPPQLYSLAQLIQSIAAAQAVGSLANG